MGINKDMVKELESSDPEELVSLLGLTSDQIIRAFPGHAYDYIQDNFYTGTEPLEVDDDREYEAFDLLEHLQDEGYSVLDESS